MVRLIFVLAAIGVTIYSGIDCLRTPAREMRGLPKPLWLLAIVLLWIPPLGGIAWLVAGRVPVPAAPDQASPRALAPDDDPEFLRSLNRPRGQGPASGPGPGGRKDRRTDPSWHGDDQDKDDRHPPTR